MESINNWYEWEEIAVAVCIFIAGVVIPALGAYIRRKSTTRWVSRRWISTVAWFSLLVFVVLADGDFIYSNVALAIALCAVATTIVFMLGSTFEEIAITKGDMRLQASSNKKKARNARTPRKQQKSC